MKNIFYLVVIILSSTLISCSYLKNVQLLSGGELKRQKFVQAIPFEMRKDLIVVKAKSENLFLIRALSIAKLKRDWQSRSV